MATEPCCMVVCHLRKPVAVGRGRCDPLTWSSRRAVQMMRGTAKSVARYWRAERFSRKAPQARQLISRSGISLEQYSCSRQCYSPPNRFPSAQGARDLTSKTVEQTGFWPGTLLYGRLPPQKTGRGDPRAWRHPDLELSKSCANVWGDSQIRPQVLGG